MTEDLYQKKFPVLTKGGDTLGLSQLNIENPVSSECSAMTQRSHLLLAKMKYELLAEMK